MAFNKFLNSKNIKTAGALIGTAALFCATSALAATGQSLGAVASNVTSTMESVGSLLGAGSYVAGFGLTISALFKFKQHKDNPTQYPLGTPVTLLFIGVALIFLPSIITTGGQTMFAGSQTSSGFSGTGVILS
jgi:intracellular multiplication protein IcmD